MGAQILEIGGKKLAVLPIEDYQRLLEIAEDREDLALAADAERRRDEGEEYLPARMVDRILDGENALRVWREYRGLNIAELAEKSGYGYSMVSKIETKVYPKPNREDPEHFSIFGIIVLLLSLLLMYLI